MAYARGANHRKAKSPGWCGQCAPKQPPGREESPPEGVLERYFKDVAKLPVMPAEEVIGLARSIEEQEVELWRELLARAEGIEALLDLVERGLRHPLVEVARLRRAAAALRRRPERKTRAAFTRWQRRAARQLRAHDLDRVVLERVLERLLERPVEDDEARHQRQLVERLSDEAMAARNSMVKANLRLVVAIAHRYNFGRLSFHDLIQEGNIGLIKAVGRFDHRRGNRFSTYAGWWIRHAITRAITDKGRLVRVPVHLMTSHTKITNATQHLRAQLGRRPTVEEICSCTNLTERSVKRLRDQPPSQSYSLDNPVSEEDDRCYHDLVEDPDGEAHVARLMDRDVFEQVEQTFPDLEPEEVDILRKRFGLLDGRARTLAEIGEGYGLSRERIRQIQQRAIEKLRLRLRQRKVM